MRFSASILALAALAGTAQAAPFTLGSTSFADGDVLARRHAGNIASNPNCLGQNVSPQLSWRDAPAGTTSYVLMMVDPEGRNGLGVVHWLAYGIPASRTAFAEGEASRPAAGWQAGVTTQNLQTYGGPCTPPDTTWHHYAFVAIATDLPPDAIPAGQSWDQVKARLDGHAKASSGLIGRFRHP